MHVYIFICALLVTLGAAFYVTVASVHPSATINEASVVASAAELRKHAVYDLELGWSCIPLAVETYGNWGKEAQCAFSAQL